MRETSLRNEILKLAQIEYPQFLNGGRFERLAMELMYKSSNASRRARELHNEGRFDRRLNDRGCVEYRYIPQKQLTSEEILQASLL